MYVDYLKNWIAGNHAEGESPLSYEEWEQKIYFGGYPSSTEWAELKSIYLRLSEIADEVEDIRVKLYRNRAHRNLNEDDWEHLDEVLYSVQSKIRCDSDNGFGSQELSQLC